MNTNLNYNGITKVWNAGHTICGDVKSIVNRFCAGCGAVRPTLYVKWPDGHHTIPCPAAMRLVSENEMEIL